MHFFTFCKKAIELAFVFILFSATGFKIRNKVEILKALEKIYKDDQKYRSFEKIAVDEEELKFIDRKNLMKVEAIFKKYGWPDEIDISDNCHISLFLVIQHAKLDKQIEYLPLLKTAAEKGKLKRNLLAMLEDRILYNQGKPQIYGTQIQQDPASDNYFVYAVENMQQVDSRREEVGLGPLRDYVARWNINL